MGEVMMKNITVIGAATGIQFTNTLPVFVCRNCRIVNGPGFKPQGIVCESAR